MLTGRLIAIVVVVVVVIVFLLIFALGIYPCIKNWHVAGIVTFALGYFSAIISVMVTVVYPYLLIWLIKVTKGATI